MFLYFRLVTEDVSKNPYNPRAGAYPLSDAGRSHPLSALGGSASYSFLYSYMSPKVILPLYRDDEGVSATMISIDWWTLSMILLRRAMEVTSGGVKEKEVSNRSVLF